MAGFSVEQFITDDIEFSSREEAISQLQKTADKYNGKHIAYGILNPGKQSPRLAFDAISTYSEDWLQRYFRQNYHVVDPVIKRVANSTAPFDWDADKHITKQEQSFFLANLLNMDWADRASQFRYLAPKAKSVRSHSMLIYRIRNGLSCATKCCRIFSFSHINSTRWR